MLSAMTPFSHRFSVLAAVLLLSGCQDKELARKVEMLETELAEVKASSTKQVAEALAKVEEMGRRLETTQQMSQDAANQVATTATSSDANFQRFEKASAELAQNQPGVKGQVFLSPNVKTPTALQTQFGVFLLRLEALGFDSSLNQYVAKIGIGNLIGLSVQEFTAKGDFGGGAPKLIPGEDQSEYVKRMEVWEKTLTPYEQKIEINVSPEGWTSFELPLNASSETDLQLIRIAISINKAQLAPSAAAKQQGGVAQLTVGGGGSTIETKYGEFLMKLIATETEGAATRVYVNIGNPLGFTISKCRLTGKFGIRAPEKLASERPEMFAQRMKQWATTLVDFDSVVIEPLLPSRWSRVSILIPESDPNKVQSMLTTLKLENLRLPMSQ